LAHLFEPFLHEQDQFAKTGSGQMNGIDNGNAESEASCARAHVLASTLYSQVTNGRATRDNHPNQTQSTSLNPSNAGNGLVLGLSGMLHHALGIWPSRDNVWCRNMIFFGTFL
jgi:hypothetical protein